MPRYFIHLSDRSASVFDDEGSDLADDEAAIKHAIWCIRDIASNCILTDQPVSLGSYMTIKREDGSEVGRVGFGEVIKFLPEDDFDPEQLTT
jgi:hypothetical protein